MWNEQHSERDGTCTIKDRTMRYTADYTYSKGNSIVIRNATIVCVKNAAVPYIVSINIKGANTTTFEMYISTIMQKVHTYSYTIQSDYRCWLKIKFIWYLKERKWHSKKRSRWSQRHRCRRHLRHQHCFQNLRWIWHAHLANKLYAWTFNDRQHRHRQEYKYYQWWPNWNHRRQHQAWRFRLEAYSRCQALQRCKLHKWLCRWLWRLHLH